LKILITGCNGFVGTHLATAAKQQGYTVLGVGTESIELANKNPNIDEYYSLDLTDYAALQTINISDVDAVINLAGLASVGASFSNPELYQTVNVGIADNVSRLIAENENTTRHIYVSSGNIYDPDQPLPITEESRLVSDGSPYATSKIAAEKAVLEYRSQGQDAIIVRPFNHLGPGQNTGFLIPDLFAKISVALAGDRKVTTGNLKTRRDYTDVRDVVKAYLLLATTPTEKLTSSVYNVCSGVSRSGEDILGIMQKYIPSSNEVLFSNDPSLSRSSDPLELVGSYSLLSKDTGWKPEIELEKTIEDFVKAASA